MIIDSHCHMYDKSFKDDFKEVYKRAVDANVKKFLMVGCNNNSNKEVINMQNTYKECFCTIGVHPSYVDETSLDYLDELEKLIISSKPHGIGECGLDYYWTKENKELQKVFFVKQLDLALKYDLPVVIHCRDAVEDMYNILASYKGLKYVLHGYSGSVQMAEKFVKIGAKLGIGGVVTFKNAKNVKETVKQIDIKYLLLETDCPYLTPTPHRGTRNEPSYLTFIAEEIARIKELSYEDVINITSKNTMELFKI